MTAPVTPIGTKIDISAFVSASVDILRPPGPVALPGATPPRLRAAIGRFHPSRERFGIIPETDA
ncbi:hypothetical protein GCM10025863_26650 [Microbacterium suwonense]|uniref:Uncharacterized protein n=1 Tax=Microbacterium suwonense TaxID=683047 RepID=A0ABN6X9E1_9MICO|nr:hypothetical protein GCM10025863_26650 [Microbacterium suwonense]